MSDAVLISIVSAVGLVLSGVLVELIRARRAATRAVDQTTKVVEQVQPNGGGSLRDSVTRIETAVDKIRETQVTHGERLARVEAKIETNCGGD